MEEKYEVEIVNDINNNNKTVNKKQPGKVLALLSMIFAFVGCTGAIFNILFGFITVAATLLLEIIPFLHAMVCFVPLIFSILAIVFSRIAKKKGNKTTKMKLGFIFGLISTIILALSIVGMTVFGIIAVVIAIILGVLAALAGAALSSILGALATITPALAPILAIVGSVLLAVAPVVAKSFSDEIAPRIVEFIAELLNSLISSGVIFLPM